MSSFKQRWRLICTIKTVQRSNFDLSLCIIHKCYELEVWSVMKLLNTWCIVSSRQELDIQVIARSGINSRQMCFHIAHSSIPKEHTNFSSSEFGNAEIIVKRLSISVGLGLTSTNGLSKSVCTYLPVTQNLINLVSWLLLQAWHSKMHGRGPTLLHMSNRDFMSVLRKLFLCTVQSILQALRFPVDVNSETPTSMKLTNVKLALKWLLLVPKRCRMLRLLKS